MALALVFAVSAAALALEALLARYFALTQWHHLSFMVISVALLGFSASGAWLNLAAGGRRWRDTRLASPAGVVRTMQRTAAAMAVSSVAMFVVLRLLPLDFFRIPNEPMQLLFLAVSYLACAVPFFFAGLVTAIAFAGGTERPGAVYAAAMGGSAAGVLLPLALLPLAGLRAALVIPGLVLLPLALLPGPAVATGGGGARRTRWLLPALALPAAALGAGIVLGHPALEPRPGPYKYLAHVLRFPDTSRVARHDTIRGRIDEVAGPTIRFAPGLSLGAGIVVPAQRALVRDGDAALFVAEDTIPSGLAHGGGVGGGVDAGAWLRAIHPAAALHLGAAPRPALVLQEGGGVLLAAALPASSRVVVAEPSRVMARRLRDLPLPPNAAMQVVEDEPRALVRRLVRRGQRFGVVLVEDWGASLAGTASHAQEPLLTVQAFRDYLALLEPDGVLSVSRRLLLPPSNAPRLAAVAAQALPPAARSSPRDHLAMIRNWDSFTLLVSPRPWPPARVARLRSFAARHGFDLVAVPDLDPEETNRFNRLAEPFHALAVAEVLDTMQAASPTTGEALSPLGEGAADRSGGIAPGGPLHSTRAPAALAAGLIDLRPPTDDRPFFNRFVRWSRLADFQRATGGRLYGLLLSGDVVALAVLAEALLLALVLLAVPWLRAPRRPASVPPASLVGYFLAIGLGFILMELMLIQRLTVALGDPVVSFKVVLGALLVWSAAGGLASERIARHRTWLAVSVAAAVVLACTIAGVLTVPWLLGLTRAVRVAAIVVLLAPLGAAVGVAFPLGLRLLAPDPAARALAWAANGCASVVGAVASTLLAVAHGIAALGLIAVAAYACATLIAAQAGRAMRAPHQ
ncbi:MAG: hypothetical protein OXH96_04050 [Spirochaetaceae bacterium]|nr:hypothetical protein [Spirochaetaceae bacterium]